MVERSSCDKVIGVFDFKRRGFFCYGDHVARRFDFAFSYRLHLLHGVGFKLIRCCFMALHPRGQRVDLFF